MLEGLQARVVAGDAALSRLAGPAGMGKSLLLRVLADRTAEQLSSVLVPNPCAGPEDLARQVLEAMDDPRQSAPQLRLVEVAKQLSDSGGLLLLVDNAERLAPEAIAALEDWHRRSDGSLRSVCAALVPIAERSTADASDDFTLLQPLELAESTALLEAAMERAGLHGPTRARFNRATMMQLQDRARGIPGRLLDEAARLLSELELVASNPADAPAPTQRALAQLEFELAAQPEAPRATRPEPRAAPDPARVGATGAPPSVDGIDGPRPDAPPERLPEIEPAALVDAPPPPIPVTRPAPAPRSRAPWLAAAAGFALVVAFGLALRPAEHDADAPRVAANAEEAPPPPVAAPPAPEPLLAAEPAATADPGIGSIEFQARVPAAPEPEVVATLPPPLVATPEPPKPPPAVAEPAPSPVADLEVIDGELGPGEWLAASFRRLGLPGDLAAQIAREVGAAFDFRHSQAGDHFRVTRTRSGELVAFDYEIAAGDLLELRVEDGRTRVHRSGALVSSRAAARD